MGARNGVEHARARLQQQSIAGMEGLYGYTGWHVCGCDVDDCVGLVGKHPASGGDTKRRWILVVAGWEPR